MMSVSSTRALGLGLIMALAASACTPLRSHQGYVVDVDLVNSIQPGVDNRQSVLQTLGTPTISSQFGGGDWYYVARDSRNLGYTLPKPVSQITLQISFDQAGNVATIAAPVSIRSPTSRPMARPPRPWVASAASSRICSAISARSVRRAPVAARAAAWVAGVPGRKGPGAPFLNSQHPFSLSEVEGHGNALASDGACTSTSLSANGRWCGWVWELL
ncbi:hypothetical protein GCM10020258_18590 [Sphingomonas yabuuchiae]